ncbi:type III secretion HpaP family protein [Paraburkholderia bannensis]|uniref:type III secretion HpaP family protein n=1 Tax=Paraburkholderia bannensis TaxID=765414 RepID=UPI002AB7859C|nr:type III secretion HpaP family protein [Paraburkholderia bannensis]
MSNDSTRLRPLRIVAPATVAANPAQPDPARSARFKSLMNAACAVRTDAFQPAPEHASEASSAPDEDPSAALSEEVSAPTPPAIQSNHEAPRASGANARRTITPRAGPSFSARMLPGDMAHEDGSSQLDRLVEHIASIIGFKRASLEEYAVTIKLDRNLIDDTTLHLAISPSRLSLRFQSPVLASRALIYAHADGLCARLEARVKRPTTITVTA